MIGFRNNKYNLRGSDILSGQRPAPQLTASNRGGLRHQNSGTHYLTQAEQFELSRLLKTVLEFIVILFFLLFLLFFVLEIRILLSTPLMF